MICPVCSEEMYNTYECANCGNDCENDLIIEQCTHNVSDEQREDASEFITCPQCHTQL